MFVNKQVVSLENGNVKIFDECGENPIFRVQPMKNNYKKGIYALSCCQQTAEQMCGFVIFKIADEEIVGNKGQFVAIVSILGIFVFLTYYFLRPVSSNF